MSALLAMALVPFSSGASHRTTNFVVEARRPRSRQGRLPSGRGVPASIARQWLDREIAAVGTPCPIRVKLTRGEAGGVTSFGFDRGRVNDQEMVVEGRLDRILASALPHEITHTVFAAYFGGPMPRWADEGASLLSEDLRQRRRHDKIAEDLLSRRGDLPLPGSS